MFPDMRRHACFLAALLAAANVLSGCRYLATGNPAPLRPLGSGGVQHVIPCPDGCRDSVDIVSLGVGGILVVPWRDTTQLIMTPPSITNPTIWWTIFGNPLLGSHANRVRIAHQLQQMPGVSTERLQQVRAVLVGHGHYDHLMDLPPMLPYMPQAVVYGSRTVTNLLAPVTERRRAVDSSAGRNDAQPGQSFPVGGGVRVRAIAWDHAPNIGRYVVARGDLNEPRRSLPRGLFGWKLGRTYAYAIDLLDGTGAVACRLFYHDSAADPVTVRSAASVVRTMPPARQTVAIITGANFDQAAHFPDLLLAHLDPAYVVVTHWEDFFRSPARPARVVRGTDAESLRERLDRFAPGRWRAVTAGATVRVGC